MPLCAICQHLDVVEPRTATGTVGLLTDLPALSLGAPQSPADLGSERHIILFACPEHVVDVYRGRIEGIRMAWRLGEANFTPVRKSPAAASAYPA